LGQDEGDCPSRTLADRSIVEMPNVNQWYAVRLRLPELGRQDNAGMPAPRMGDDTESGC